MQSSVAPSSSSSKRRSGNRHNSTSRASPKPKKDSCTLLDEMDRTGTIDVLRERGDDRYYLERIGTEVSVLASQLILLLHCCIVMKEVLNLCPTDTAAERAERELRAVGRNELRSWFGPLFSQGSEMPQSTVSDGVRGVSSSSCGYNGSPSGGVGEQQVSSSSWSSGDDRSSFACSCSEQGTYFGSISSAILSNPIPGPWSASSGRNPLHALGASAFASTEDRSQVDSLRAFNRGRSLLSRTIPGTFPSTWARKRNHQEAPAAAVADPMIASASEEPSGGPLAHSSSNDNGNKKWMRTSQNFFSYDHVAPRSLSRYRLGPCWTHDERQQQRFGCPPLTCHVTEVMEGVGANDSCGASAKAQGSCTTTPSSSIFSGGSEQDARPAGVSRTTCDNSSAADQSSTICTPLRLAKVETARSLALELLQSFCSGSKSLTLGVVWTIAVGVHCLTVFLLRNTVQHFALYAAIDLLYRQGRLLKQIRRRRWQREEAKARGLKMDERRGRSARGGSSVQLGDVTDVTAGSSVGASSSESSASSSEESDVEKDFGVNQ
ncbi:unnamed protein product [Amoebophrya sp. A25]|nr:unnamed protein product [Amoebophrya sp. A25]|eukprot:GSA25T00026361001.1